MSFLSRLHPTPFIYPAGLVWSRNRIHKDFVGKYFSDKLFACDFSVFIDLLPNVFRLKQPNEYLEKKGGGAVHFRRFFLGQNTSLNTLLRVRASVQNLGITPYSNRPRTGPFQAVSKYIWGKSFFFKSFEKYKKYITQNT